MRKQKFVITNHTQQNGNYYYTCKVSVETVRRPKNIFELFRYGVWNWVDSTDEYYVHSRGTIFKHIEEHFYDSLDALLAIDKYIQRREEEDGEKVVSTKTEIIYR